MSDAHSFEIEVTALHNGEYTLWLRSSLAGDEQISGCRLSFGNLPGRDLRIEEWIQRIAAGNGRACAEPFQNAKWLGERLYSSLFQGAIGNKFSMLPTVAQKKRICVRLRLPDELGAYPWEILYNDQFLSLNPYLSLVRTTPTRTPIRLSDVTPPIQVLAILASPTGQPKIDLPREERILRKVLEAPKLRRNVQLEIIQRDQSPGANTLEELKNRLLDSDRPVHIIHVLCHGLYDTTTGGQLLLVDEEGSPQHVGPDQFAAQLQRQQGNLRLVVLNSCDSAISGEASPLSSIARQLVQIGVPGVIAMQFKIDQDSAAQLTETLYKQLLLSGMPIDQAMQETRIFLNGLDGNNLSWAIPTLFLRSDNPMVLMKRETSVPSHAGDHPEKLWEQGLMAMAKRDWQNAIQLFEQLQELPSGGDYLGLQDRIADCRRQEEIRKLWSELEASQKKKNWREADKIYEKLRERLDTIEQKTETQRLLKFKQWIDAQRRRQQDIESAIDELSKKNYKNAGDLVRKILKAHPDDEYAKELLTRIREEMSKQEEQDDPDLQQALEEARQETIEHIRIHFELKHYVVSLEEATRFLKENSADSGVLDIIAMITNEAPDLNVRAGSARLLSVYGDPRPGVETIQPAWCSWFGAGRYDLGEIEVHILQDFAIAQYPVTERQYQRFREKGYHNDTFWSQSGQRWRLAADQHRASSDPNIPACSISWFEANAFCAWLTDHLRSKGDIEADEIVRLPTEAEWRLAASCDPATRAQQQSIPAQFLDELLPVGAATIPGHKSPCGAYDMGSNIWEWCATAYYDPMQPEERVDFLEWLGREHDDAIQLIEAELLKKEMLQIAEQPAPEDDVPPNDRVTVLGKTIDGRGYRSPDTRDPALGFRVCRARKKKDS